jgi:hypothetical protein
VDEVGGAVQRIDDPDEVAALLAMLLAGLFGQDAVVGVGGEERLDDGGFAGVVDLGDEVVDLLLRHTDRLDVERGAVDDGAGGACGLDGHVEHGMESRACRGQVRGVLRLIAHGHAHDPVSLCHRCSLWC